MPAQWSDAVAVTVFVGRATTGLFAGRMSNAFSCRKLTATCLLLNAALCALLTASYGNIWLMVPVIGLMGVMMIAFSNSNQRSLVNSVPANQVGICMALNGMGRSTSLPMGTVSIIASLSALQTHQFESHTACQITTVAFVVPLCAAAVVTCFRRAEDEENPSSEPTQPQDEPDSVEMSNLNNEETVVLSPLKLKEDERRSDME